MIGSTGQGRSMLETLVGTLAAICTTVSYIPQVKKCWETKQTGDLSLKMLAILAAGIFLWVVYGFIKSDWVIVLANGVSLALLSNLLGFKILELRRKGGKAAA
ncbi:MAG: SemiSWEET transporter [Beijerinckiaceae bacterium]|nr:SemiSWEET transporter [Beijerinckiaceae bacterium]